MYHVLLKRSCVLVIPLSKSLIVTLILWYCALCIARFREVDKLSVGARAQIEALLVDEPGTNIRVMLLMLVLRRGWIELFAASVLCGTDRPRNVQKFVIKLLFWLTPELVSAREQAELSTLARLVAMNDNSTCKRAPRNTFPRSGMFDKS